MHVRRERGQGGGGSAGTGAHRMALPDEALGPQGARAHGSTLALHSAASMQHAAGITACCTQPRRAARQQAGTLPHALPT